MPTRRILRPQRAENADSFNGSSSTSDSAQSAPDIVSTSTPPSPSPPAAAASSSSSAESKDENENGDGDGGKDGDDSATSDIIGNSNSSSSGGTDQEVTASSITAKGSSAGDADMDVEEDQTVASSVKQEIDTALPEHKEGEGALSSIPSVAPVPSLSLSSTSVDEQGDKVALKEDEVQDNAMDVDKDVEVKGEGEGEVMMEVKGEGEVKMEVEGEREGEGDVEVKDTVKDEEEEKEKEKKPDQTILDQSASGPELKSELTEVSSTDATNPDPVTGAAADSSSVAVVSGDVTSDATEGSVSSETKATEEGMVVDLLPVKSEIKDEPVASSSASSSSASSSSSSASSSTTSAPAPAPAPDSKDDKAVVKDEKKITPSSSTDTSSKAKDAAAAAAAVVPPVMPESLPRAPDTFSAIHSLRGYLDVGSASLFAPSEPWVLATASLLMKRKLSKS